MDLLSKRAVLLFLPCLASIATTSLLFSELLPCSALRLHFKDGSSPEAVNKRPTLLMPQKYQVDVAPRDIIAGWKEKTGPRQQPDSYRELRRLEDTVSSTSSGSSSSASSSTPPPTPQSTLTIDQTTASTPMPTTAAPSVGTNHTSASSTIGSTPSPSSASTSGEEDVNDQTPSPTEATTAAPSVGTNHTSASSTIGSTPSPSSASTSGEEDVNDQTPSPTEATSSLSEDTENDDDGNNKVATPYFADDSTTYIMSYTLHIMCDTEGATIRYTLDGTDPAPGGEDGVDGSPTAYQVPAGESELVQQIGTFTIRAVATKEGMHVSDEISKAVTVTERVADPELHFEGAPGDGDDTYLRLVTIVMNCSTPTATIRYTTDGSSPDENSANVSSGDHLVWAEEGITVFNVGAFAEGLYRSNVKTWTVKIVAQMTDEYPLADDSSLEEGDVYDMAPMVEVTPFKVVYAAPSAELEQQEQLGPGYGECEGGARVVTGKLLRVFNPKRHVSFAAPQGACGDDGDNDGDSDGDVFLAMAAETAEAFEQPRETAPLLSGESQEDARVRLNLDAREEAWRAAGGDGCQVVAPGGLLGVGGGDVGAGCVVGHLVSGGRVVRAGKETALVSFGIRGGKYVVGNITEKEVLDQENPFQELVSGAGWLVRGGVNHVQASGSEGHLDVLRVGDEEEGKGEGLDDVMAAKLARTAIGHDDEGRLILLQTSGASLSDDQDTAIPEGLTLSELADILVEAGARNAVNLVSGSPAALTVNDSAVVDPAEACSSDGAGTSDSSGTDFVFTGSNEGGESVSLSRCERPVSSIVCIHLDPPPVASGYEDTPSPAAGHGSSSTAYGGEGSNSTSGGGGGWSSDDDDEENMRLQWTEELCSGNGTGNGTELWQHLDDVEEALFRYRIAFWVAAGLGMISLFLNIQRHKRGGRLSRHGASAGVGAAGIGGAPYAHVGLVNGAVVPKPELEMGKIGSKRAQRKGGNNRRKGSSSRGGAYAPVNGDVDWNGTVMGGVPHGMDSEEEVDLGLGAPPPRGSSSSRKKDKSKSSSRLQRALAKVSKRRASERGGVDTVPGDGDLDSTMPINPFGSLGNGRADYDDEEGTWA